MIGKWIFAAILSGLLACGGAAAQERKAYKYLDEKGNVVYSQTPPVDGKNAKQVNISPAQTGLGGNSAGGRGAYVPPVYYEGDRRFATPQDYQNYQKQREEAAKRRLAELEAECNRNRGADCKNPKTLRDMEAQNVPGGRRYPAVR